MGCGCNKRVTGSSIIQVGSSTLNTEDWGPILWKYVHSVTERIGYGDTPAQNETQGALYTNLIKFLHLIVPCTICQGHAKAYLEENPFPTMSGLTGDAMRMAGRTWLFNFHSAVRQRKEQPVLVTSLDECRSMYEDATITSAEYSKVVRAIASAVRNHWVKMENWRKWYNYSEQLRAQIRQVVV